MRPSTVFALLSLAGGSLGAFMPRRSAGTSQCLACSYEDNNGDILSSSTVNADDSVTCEYAGSTADECDYDSTGALSQSAAAGPNLCNDNLESIQFQCEGVLDGQLPLTFQAADDTQIYCAYTATFNNNLVFCYYDLVTGQNNPQSEDACGDSVPCGQPPKRRSKVEDNFAAVKRRKAARAAAPTTPRPAFGLAKLK